jgi:chromosome segregation ATPase
MANANTQLSNMIEELVQQKTFGLDALDAIRELKSRAELLESEIKRKDDQITTLTQDCQAKNERLAAQEKELAKISAREIAVAARESKIHQNELIAAVAQARAGAFEQSMKIVFAPNRVRDSVQSWGSVANNGMSVPINDSRVVSRTEGYAQEGDTDAAGSPGSIVKQTL